MTDLHEQSQPAAPDRPDGGIATRVAAGVAETGFGVDPDGGEVRYVGRRLAALAAVLVAVGVFWPWVLVVVLAIAAMIFLHELGHYVMAKRAGMKVTEFFLGFGPKLWSFRRGETEYGLKLIPAGAYVKIIGMTNLEEVDPADEGRTYRQKTFGQRVGVAVAGSAMHFMLAFVLIFAALAFVGQPGGTLDPSERDRQWSITNVASGTGAEAIGLREGDRITSLDGNPIETFDDLKALTPSLRGKTIPITYVRDGESVSDTVTLKPFYSWSVYRVIAGSSIAEAGMVPGDDIDAIDGRPTSSLSDLDELLSSLQGTEVPVTWTHVTYDEDDERTAVQQTADVELDSLILWGQEGYVGIEATSIPPRERLGPVDALLETPKQFLAVAGLSVQGLARVATPSGVVGLAEQVRDARDDETDIAADDGIPRGNESSATLMEEPPARGFREDRPSSIVGIVQIGSGIASIDPGSLIGLFALFNIFIGIFNLVPLLPFDGGHVAIAAYELIQEKRKRMAGRRYFTDVSKLLPLTYVVVVLLGLLFVSTLYLDLANPLSVS